MGAPGKPRLRIWEHNLFFEDDAVAEGGGRKTREGLLGGAHRHPGVVVGACGGVHASRTVQTWKLQQEWTRAGGM